MPNSQGGFFLPPYSDCTASFLNDFCEGKKQLLFAKDVGHIKVKRLPEFSVASVTQAAYADPTIAKYLPDRDLDKNKPLNRAWLFAVRTRFCNDSDYRFSEARLLPIQRSACYRATQGRSAEASEGGQHPKGSLPENPVIWIHGIWERQGDQLAQQQEATLA